jgi:predicted Zn-dependent protease
MHYVLRPGGKIVVYTGILDRFKTDAEIATVLGHEVIINTPDFLAVLSSGRYTVDSK